MGLYFLADTTKFSISGSLGFKPTKLQFFSVVFAKLQQISVFCLLYRKSSYFCAYENADSGSESHRARDVCLRFDVQAVAWPRIRFDY